MHAATAAAARGGPLRGTWATGKNGTPEKILLYSMTMTVGVVKLPPSGGGGPRGLPEQHTYCCQKGVTSLSVGEETRRRKLCPLDKRMIRNLISLSESLFSTHFSSWSAAADGSLGPAIIFYCFSIEFL